MSKNDETFYDILIEEEKTVNEIKKLTEKEFLWSLLKISVEGSSMYSRHDEQSFYLELIFNQIRLRHISLR